MAFEFGHSVTALDKLAQQLDLSSPSKDDQPFEFVDRGLMIIARKLQAQDKTIKDGFLEQQRFFVAELRDLEKRTDERFREVEERFRVLEKKMDERFREVDERFRALEKKMDERFREMEKKIDERFREMEKKTDERFRKIEERFDNFEVRFDNFEARASNGRLRRMHQAINLIRVLKPTSNIDEFKWATPSRMPKHVKDLYRLGQHAQGLFEGTWEGKTDREKPAATRKALDTIGYLAKFYQIEVLTDDMSESDATEYMLVEDNVDLYMEALLDKWGMDWQKICKIGKQHTQPQTQQVAAKRAGDTTIGTGKPMKQYRGEEDDS